MKALIFRETGEPKSVLQLAETPTPPLAPGEALVRVLLSPFNASNLHMVRGRYGYQPELPASPVTCGDVVDHEFSELPLTCWDVLAS